MQVVALMAEDQTGIGNFIARQLLRTRRGFRTTVFSPDGAWRGMDGRVLWAGGCLKHGARHNYCALTFAKEKLGVQGWVGVLRQWQVFSSGVLTGWYRGWVVCYDAGTSCSCGHACLPACMRAQMNACAHMC